MKDGKPVAAYSPRGMDVDRNGVVWIGTASGHLVSFDRRKCKAPLNGPNATGQHCAEGFTVHPLPGPNYKGSVASGSADSPYYTFVDRFDLLGTGSNNVPMVTGNESEALVALVNGRMQTFRVPYPLGYLREGLRRPHRRSQRRMEGQGDLLDVRHACAVPLRRRQGNDEQGGEVAGSSQSTLEVI